MASLNQVSIELQVKGEREATQALKRYSNASDKLTRSVLNAAGKVESTTNAWTKANRLFEKGILNTKGLQAAQTQLARELAVVNGYTKSNGALNTQKALAELRAAQATRETAAAEKAANAERQRAKQSYNNLLASINPTIAAQQRNARVAATVRDAVRSGAISRREAIETIRQYKAAQDALNVTQSATASKYTPQVKRQTNQLGVVFQQAGYQVGDFAVQVQSGTNYMVAFGQQMTQLVGVGAMLSKSTKWIAAFSTAGIIVPIFTAIAGAFMRASEGAQKLETSIDALSSAIAAMESSLEVQKATIFELVEDYGSLAFAIRDTKQAMAEAAALKAFIAIREDATLTTGVVDRLRVATENLATAQRGAFEELPNIIRSAEDPLQRAEVIVQGLAKELGLSEEQARKFGQALQDFDNAENFRQQAVAANDIVKFLDLIPDSVKEGNLALLETIQKMGTLAEDTSRLANEAPSSGWMDNAIKGVNGLINRIIEGINKIRTLKGESEDRSFIERYEAGEFQGTPNVSGFRSAEYFNLLDRQAMTAGTSGGSSGAGRDPAKEFNRAKAAVDQLRASYDEQFATSLKVAEAEEKINKAMELGVYTKEQGKDALDEYIASLNDAENPMQKIAQTARDALGDAFMSIVDGTKSASDAFKDMARAILKQAFELLVIQPILDGLFGGLTGGSGGGIFSLFSANGNAFSGGNVIPFANGGVVGGPTAFPMASGKMGLMGEAGPEAIMPLKRGKGGKLGVVAEGSSQPVVVNQSFNFSANGDDSVKRIIAQEAPKIANLTQKQILESRSRGGAFRTTFGT